jgi:hypothetical protein
MGQFELASAKTIEASLKWAALRQKRPSPRLRVLVESRCGAVALGCTYLSGTKERRAWKKESPTFEFNGVTYQDHWSPQLSNSGKTTRWMGYLSGSDGSTHEI